jgi:nitrate/TMAO reductase-like tetraheme cytochrome c subunit
MIFRSRKRRRDQRSAAPPDDAAAGEGSPQPTEPGETTGPSDEGTPRGPFASTRAALAPIKKRHVMVASIGLMGVAAAGVFLFSAVSFWWTSQPSFCNRCHVMEPYVEAWEQSAHRDVSCESCHLTPGFFGFLGGKISGLQVVMNYIRGEYEDWSFNAAVSNAACIQCHESILEGNVHDNASGITVSHLDIIRMGGKCLNCHSTVAHGAAVSVGSETHPTMATCLKCHNDKIAPLDCDLCHTGREPPAEQPGQSPTAVPSVG